MFKLEYTLPEPKAYLKYDCQFAFNYGELTEEVLKLTKEELQQIEANWKQTEEENRKIYKENYDNCQAVIKETMQYLRKLGYKTNKDGSLLKQGGYYKGAQDIADAVRAKFKLNTPSKPTFSKIKVKGKVYSANSSPISLVDLVEHVRGQLKREEEARKQSDKKVKEAIRLAAELQLDVDELTVDQIVYEVNEVMKEKFIEDNYPEGTSVYLKHACSECSEWVVGERRCTCGNRRIDLVVEGDFLSGFDAYPEAY